MAKVPLTISIRQEDLVRLDAYAGERRLTRGDAVGMLLDEREGPVGGDDPDYVPPPPNRSRLERAKDALASGEAKLGIHPTDVYGNGSASRGGEIVSHPPQILKKRDPLDQSSEYDDEGVQVDPGVDFDQTRRRR